MNSQTIWKFAFGIADSFELDMPQGARILHVECQGKQPTIWAQVNPQVKRESRTFFVVGTGHNVPNNAVHVATFQQPPFVWHLFRPGNIGDMLGGLVT